MSEEEEFLQEIAELIPNETWKERLEWIKNWQYRSDCYTNQICDDQSDIYGR